MAEPAKYLRSLFSLEGKVALVTGSTKGLGWATAQALAGAGAHVVLNSRHADEVAAKVRQLAGTGLAASGAAFDVAHEAAALDALDRIASEEGGLDVLVNNAAVIHRSKFLDVKTDDWRQEVETNITTKHGLVGLTRAIAVEFGHKSVTCNTIAPGFFRTELNVSQQQHPKTDEQVRSRTPLRRWAEPQELAGAVVFLASDASSYVNGLTLYVDGGLTAAF